MRFLRTDAPENWRNACGGVTDIFRVIDPADFRSLAWSGHSQRRALCSK
jgi:hypothetical protein